MKIYVAKNGRQYIKLNNGQTRFISNQQINELKQSGGSKIPKFIKNKFSKKKQSSQQKQLENDLQELNNLTEELLGEDFVWFSSNDPYEFFLSKCPEDETMICEEYIRAPKIKWNKWVILGRKLGYTMPNLK